VDQGKQPQRSTRSNPPRAYISSEFAAEVQSAEAILRDQGSTRYFDDFLTTSSREGNHVIQDTNRAAVYNR